MKIKNFAIRSLAAFMAAFISIFATAGCNDGMNNDNPDDITYTESEYFYIAQEISLPDDIKNINNITYFNGKIFFSTSVTLFEHSENEYLSTSYADIYTIKIDGSELSKLDFYKPGITAPDGVGCMTEVAHIATDGIGNLWIAEKWLFYDYDLPVDFDSNDDDVYKYYTVVDSGYTVCKLDSSGNELLTFDLSNLKENHENLYISAFSIAETGSGEAVIIMACPNNPASTTSVYVLSDGGEILLRHTAEEDFERFVHLPDGEIAYPVKSHYNPVNPAQELQIIDMATMAISNTLTLPALGLTVFDSSGGHEILISDSNSVFGYTPGDVEAEKLFSWYETNLLTTHISNMIVTQEGHIICLNNKINNANNKPLTELYLLVKTHPSELPPVTVLELAATEIMSPSFYDAVAEFNSTNLLYRVEVTNYNLTQLNTQIVSNKIPDLFYLTSMPFSDFAQSGLFADLYQFIDIDPEYNRSSFVPAALRAAETEGKLYQLFPSFMIQTITGKESVLGSGISWNVKDIMSVIGNHPEADIPFGAWMSKTTFLVYCINLSMNDYIDIETGTAYFNTPEFIELLELSNSISKYITGEDALAADTGISTQEAISSGRQLMAIQLISSFYTPDETKDLMGEDAIFKGFPSRNSDGIIFVQGDGFAIADSSPNKAAAWQFVRLLLDKDWQLENVIHSFPVNQAAMDGVIENILKTGFCREFINGEPVYTPAPGDIEQLQKDIDLVLSLVEASSAGSVNTVDEALYNIISESAAGYFAGNISAGEAADIIQSRASIYLSERT